MVSRIISNDKDMKWWLLGKRDIRQRMDRP